MAIPDEQELGSLGPVGNWEEAGAETPAAPPPPPLAIAESPSNSALAIPGSVGNSEEDLDFAPASVGNVEALAIQANWRWEFRMRKTVFGIFIRERGKDRASVMYLGPKSPDPKIREYWKQFLPEYEKWSQNGFKRRVKYSRLVSRLSDVMV